MAEKLDDRIQSSCLSGPLPPAPYAPQDQREGGFRGEKTWYYPEEQELFGWDVLTFYANRPLERAF